VGRITGNNLFKYGFINVENKDFKYFCKYMDNHKNIRWGGGKEWRSKDVMHFGLKKSAQSSLKVCDEYKNK
jgi:hypothetical protein